MILGCLSLIKGSICLQKIMWSRYFGSSSDEETTSKIETKLSYFLPGFALGLLSFYFVDSDYRNLVSMYTFSRCLDLLWGSYKKRKGWETGSVEYGLLYMFMTSLIVCAFVFDPDVMPDSLHRLYLKFSSLTQEELIQKNLVTYKFNMGHYS